MEKYFISGDIHGNIVDLRERIESVNAKKLILLGDTGINWYGGKKDIRFKTEISNLNCELFVIRGNHDMPPNEIAGIKKVFNEEIKNYVLKEDEFPLINYLIDGEIYYFNKYKCLVIGGAYSVDKYWRLENKWIWFKNEQVPIEDRIKIFAETRDIDFDFVLTHTCPYSWMPTDKFLSFIDQSKVDNSMEFWLEEIKNSVSWIGIWLFAHYHIDRIERPYVEVMYRDIEDLDAIRERWNNYARTKELPWWLEKSPNFYQEEKKINAKN